MSAKTIDEKIIPPICARIDFLELWDIANFLIKGNAAEKEYARTKLDVAKEAYERTKEQAINTCTTRYYSSIVFNRYYSKTFENHELGKLWKRIKNADENKDKKELAKIISEIKTRYEYINTANPPRY